MAVICPKHQTELKLQKTLLEVFQKHYSVVIGSCPKCNIKYVNRYIFKSGDSVSINGTNYEFLDGLSREFPFDPQEEVQRQAKEEEEKQRAEKAKRKAEHKQKQLKKKQELEDKQKKEKAAAVYELFASDSRRPFHPAFVYHCDEIPELCPFDQKKLLYLTHVIKHGHPSREGFCCPYCSRLFIKKKSDLQTETKPKENKEERPREGERSKPVRPTGALILPPRIDSNPKTALLIARIAVSGYGEIGSVAIVANERYQNTKEGIFWVGRTLPSVILAAIQTNQHGQFEYKGLHYRVVSYKDFYLTKKYLDIVARFCKYDAPQTVFVFAQKNIDHFQGEKYEMVTAMVPCMKMPYPVPITVYYDKEAHRYYLNETTYDIAKDKFGLPYLKLRSAAEYSHFKGFSGLKQQSILFRLGYSVSSSSGLTLLSRRKLLGEIIDSGILTKAEVMTHLEWLINTRYGMDHMDNAIGEWRADLRYISEYRAKEQRTIWVEAFKSRFSGIKIPIKESKPQQTM